MAAVAEDQRKIAHPLLHKGNPGAVGPNRVQLYIILGAYGSSHCHAEGQKVEGLSLVTRRCGPVSVVCIGTHMVYLAQGQPSPQFSSQKISSP